MYDVQCAFCTFYMSNVMYTVYCVHYIGHCSYNYNVHYIVLVATVNTVTCTIVVTTIMYTILYL